MTAVVLAVLAHDKPDCLADLVANLRAFAPEAAVVVFNGGRDPHLTAGLPVQTCRYSRPLTHHRVGVFHGLVMQELFEQFAPVDFLVTLDSDMLLLKPGLAAFLVRSMADSGYMGSHLGQVLPDTPWRPGRRVHRKWSPHWRDLLELEHPYRSFNPGQVFGRAFLERFETWPRRAALMDALARTRLDALDEIVWASLARTLDVGVVENPGGRALKLRRHRPAEIASYLDDPDTFFLHRVGMQVDATERRIVRELMAGRRLDIAAESADYARYDPPPRWRPAAALVKDVAQSVLPASRRR